MPHQKRAFLWAKRLARIALFMEMRLGKTLVAVRWVHHNDLKKVLVLAPLDILDSWQEELQKERVADEDILIISGPTTERVSLARNSPAIWNLTNYETVNYDTDILDLKWDAVILDESTTIKNPRSDISKYLVNRTLHIRFKAILTGTPAPECERDYFMQFSFLYNKNFMHYDNWWHWTNKYYYQAGYDWIARSGTKEKIKYEVSRLAFVLSAEDAGIGNKRIYEKRYVELNEEQKKQIQQIKDSFEYTVDGKPVMTKYSPVQYEWLHRVAGGFLPDETLICKNKISRILYLLKTELKGKSIVVCCKYTAEISTLEKELNKNRIECATLYSKDRKLKKEFEAGKVRVMIAQPMCAQFGLDWSIASTMIFYSNWWSAKVRSQIEKRIEHPKKKHPLLYIDMMSKNSMDQIVLKVIHNKISESTEFLREVHRLWQSYKM